MINASRPVYRHDHSTPCRRHAGSDHDAPGAGDGQLSRISYLGPLRSDHDGQIGARVQLERVAAGETVVELAGEVDSATVDGVKRAVLDAVTASPGHLIYLDLRRIRFLAACAVSILLVADNLTRHYGGTLRLLIDEASPAARTLARLPGVALPTVTSVPTRTERFGK